MLTNFDLLAARHRIAGGIPRWRASSALVSEEDLDLTYPQQLGVDRQQMLGVLHKLERVNGLAGAVITLITGFAASGPVRFRANAKRVQKVLDEFWSGEDSEWDLRFFQLIKEWRLFGEQLLPVEINEINGGVTLRNITPDKIHKVEVNKVFESEIVNVVVKEKDGFTETKYRVIGMKDEPDLAVKMAFFLRANPLSVDPRGYSDLLSMIDFFPALEDLAFTSVERAAQQLSWTKHIKMKGMLSVDEETEKQAKRKFGSTKPGAAVVTGDNVELTNIVPQLEAAQTAEEVKMIVNLIAGAANMPAAWLGFGEANRATLDNLSGPTIKMLDTVRRELSYEMRKISRFVVRCAKSVGVIGPMMDTRFAVELPEIATEDMQNWGRTIAQVTTAAMLAHRNEFITLRTASDMVRRVVQNIGVTYDVEREIKERHDEEPTFEQQRVGKGDTPTAPRSTEPDNSRNNQ